MTAIQSLKHELVRLATARDELINEAGYINTGSRYRYQLLVRQAAAIRQSIEYLNELYHDRATA